MGIRYRKYRSIAIALNIGIELLQVSRYFDISNIKPALPRTLHSNLFTFNHQLFEYVGVTNINVDSACIGLKTSESDLERLKCPRCEYQAYYEQQYQEHIANAHVDEVHRCKCCNFATFDKDSLLAHFKVWCL